ncbi:unnamed protein product [Nippostrongylus brasiliensis]|uniref:BPTI/Kunitz inhibitor domain-containing protein n=1 Tax=Nippostrongylus brasiliensis TaxID=27835 RepID=A0A0N4XJJ6_NIPBR|nr:unnamed protein product [Nippostrongylus brasiliensis]
MMIRCTLHFVKCFRFYYDDASKLCRSFTFTGCGGNENNFKTKGECTQFCSSEIICPRGDPHPDRYSINKIATCHENKHCPRNYTCTARFGKKGACCPSRGALELRRSLESGPHSHDKNSLDDLFLRT